MEHITAAPLPGRLVLLDNDFIIYYCNIMSSDVLVTLRYKNRWHGITVSSTTPTCIGHIYIYNVAKNDYHMLGFLAACVAAMQLHGSVGESLARSDRLNS